MELSFNNLRCKDVVNICDGKNLGQISDIIIDTCCARIVGIVVPYSKNFFSIFKSNNDIFIPFNRICKIGKDIILVDIIIHNEYTNNQYNQINTCNITNQNNNFNQDKINISNMLNNDNTIQF